MDFVPVPCDLELVLFDFGGVLADEGFANGLRAIGKMNRALTLNCFSRSATT